MVIVPVYSSGLFNDEARLVFCLVAHPLILEFCLHMCRQNSVTEYDRNAQAVGLDPGSSIHDLKERELFVLETGVPLIIEAILVFNRRFLIG